jgi:tetratricopeptide (TPR) repeat protein
LQTHLRKLGFAFTLVVWIISQSAGQYRILEDARATSLVQAGMDSIYNLNFTAADSIIEILDNKLGEYPGNLLLKAFYTSWKYRPLMDGQDSYDQFESYLKKSIDLCEAKLDENEDDEEANFFMMASHAFLAELYVNNGHNLRALGEAKSAYKYIKIGFEQLEHNPEFYFSSGIYNYYREKYPEENPFYKPFLWFFRSGDKEEGINMLKKGAEKASFTKAECLTYLFHIYLRYEDNPSSAIPYAALLKDKYPRNLHYIANFVENRIRLNRYENLRTYIQQLRDSRDDYYNYLGEIFLGDFLENNAQNLEAALLHYNKADKIGEEKECRVLHYDSILFLGMGRIYQKQNKNELAGAFLKKSAKSAEYQSYRKDAEELLKDL